VIVKQITTTEFTDSQNGEPSDRQLTEWIALRFLNTLADEGTWPTLLAANRGGGFVILEDVGEHPTVLDLLMSSDTAVATLSLEALGASLGQVHAAARDHTDEFIRIRSELGVGAPKSDSTFDLRTVAGELRHSFDFFDVDVPLSFWSDVDALEAAIHTPGPFHTLIHGDAGPHNFLWTGQTTRLIDYEFATIGHGLLDVVSARLGFPHCDESQAVPQEQVDVVEESYLQVMAGSTALVEAEDVYRRAVTDACAHWALSRWVRRWRRLFGDDHNVTRDAPYRTGRSQAVTLLRGFISVANTTNHREAVAAVLGDVTHAIQRCDPELTRMPNFPAYRS
jgi:tRNA A-37 threonylcarbamoyl transferase component Bud32